MHSIYRWLIKIKSKNAEQKYSTLKESLHAIKHSFSLCVQWNIIVFFWTKWIEKKKNKKHSHEIPGKSNLLEQYIKLKFFVGILFISTV